MQLEVSKVGPETRCQGSSAPGITANYICKGEAMRSIFNGSVDCNIKQVLNNAHVCARVAVSMCQNAIPKPAILFPAAFVRIHRQGLFKMKNKSCLIAIKKRISVVETSVFMLLSQVCVYLWGLAFYPCVLAFRRAPKARGHGVQTGSRPHVSSQKETWGLLALHFLSILDSVGPRQKNMSRR